MRRYIYISNGPRNLVELMTSVDFQFSKHGQFYQLRTPARWVIVVPRQFIDEIRTAPSTQLNAQVSANDVRILHKLIFGSCFVCSDFSV
jgi:hypothetical protein